MFDAKRYDVASSERAIRNLKGKQMDSLSQNDEDQPASYDATGRMMLDEVPLPPGTRYFDLSTAPILNVKPSELRDAEKNIKASVKMIKRISDRIENPTPAKVGSVWNFSGREQTNKFGEYIGRVYKDKRWESK